VVTSNDLAASQDANSKPLYETSEPKPKGKQIISFDRRIEVLRKFKQKHGHCDPDKSSKDYKCSHEVPVCIQGEGPLKLTQDRILHLEEIGFKWILPPPIDTTNISFDQCIEKLKDFEDKHGHCDLRLSSKDHTSLSMWCHSIRNSHNEQGKMKITEDRIRRLEEIGFKWRTRVEEVANCSLSSENHDYKKHSDEDSADHPDVKRNPLNRQGPRTKFRMMSLNNIFY